MVRVEDEGFLRGRTSFVRDLPAADCAHVSFVRSPHAHARLTSIDVADAAARTGVIAVLTADDLGLAPFRFFDMIPEQFARPPLASGEVRFAGEPVAVVVADRPAEALDGAEAVVVGYEPLPAVLDPFDALAAGDEIVIGYDRGRIDGIFDAAAHVVSARVASGRIAPAPMECTGVIARPAGAGVELVTTSQGVSIVQEEVARALGLNRDQVRVQTPAVGGGFGGRHSAPIEVLIVAAASRHLRRPLRWDETRTENLLTMVHGRAQAHDIELGFDDDGAIVGMRVSLLADAGAYPHFGPIMPFASRKMACGPYRVPEVDYSFASVRTNTNPIGPYRGAGQPETTLALETMIDRAAADLGIDPAELRRRNMLGPDELPHTTPTKATYDSGDYPATLARACELVGYDALRDEQQRRRASGDRVQVGVGLSSYVSMTASGDSEFGAVSVGSDGEIVVRCGTLNHGQSHATTIGSIAAEALGVDPGAITYIDGDTDLVPRGGGTGGSRSAQMGGSAVLRASEAVLDRARAIAAELLEADAADLVVSPAADGTTAGLAVIGVPTSTVTWAQLAAAAGPDGLVAEVDFEASGVSYPSGTHAAVVEVDVETGEVRIRSHVAVDDCGSVLNAAAVEGQQHGGSVAGISQALYEAVVHDPDGTPLTTTFADYLVPSAADVCPIITDTVEIPTPHNPTGAKGIGENGAIGATPAVLNATVDALRHLGVTSLELPLAPERVWRAIEHARPPA